MTKGIYVTPTEFVSFAEPKRRASALGEEVATRARSMDVAGFSFLLPNPDPILKRQGKDMRVYRDLRSDAHVGGCIRRRKASVKKLERRVVGGKAGARAVRRAEDLFAALNMDRVMNEVLDGVLYGWQPLELMWGYRAGALQPLDVVGKPGEWFTFDNQAQLRFRSREHPLHGEELEPRKFLLARQEASYANPYGFADLSMCFWPTVFKRGGLKFWVTFTEKYGTPWLVGKQPRGTPGPEVDALLDKLEAMIQDAVAAIPDDSSIDILEAGDKGASADLYKELLMFCRSEVSIALLGQNQSTEASSTHASAMAGLEVADAIRDGDARMVEATLNQLLRWVTDLNEGESAPAPTVELYEEESVNTALAERDSTLKGAGVNFTQQYWMRTYKLEKGDIEERAAPVPGAPAEFAEGRADEGVGMADQVALDAALNAVADGQLQDQMRAVLAPVFEQLRHAQDPQALLGWLAERFPGLDGDALQERLARLMFAAQVWGRLHGD
jgi:phage gp29-like protein